MSWLSRLLGEMHDETKYKPSSEFIIKTSKGQIKLESGSYENKREDTVKLFSQEYAKKYDKKFEIDSIESKDTSLDSFENFEKLDKEMELGKPLNYEDLDVRELLIESHPKLSKEEVVETQKKAARVMGIIVTIILVMIGLVVAFGYEAVKPLLSWAWIIVAIPFLFFGKREKKLFKLTK